MKIKEGFALRKVGADYIVVAVGKRVKEFNGVINLNATSAFIWQMLEKGATKEELITALLNEYDVEKEKATLDIEKFLQKLTDNNILE